MKDKITMGDMIKYAYDHHLEDEYLEIANKLHENNIVFTAEMVLLMLYCKHEKVVEVC